MTELNVSDSPKMLREALCLAQGAVNRSVYDESKKPYVSAVLQRLINECDRHRPLGVDGKHGNLHTDTCGCEDKPYDGKVHVLLGTSPSRNETVCGKWCPYSSMAGNPINVTCTDCAEAIKTMHSVGMYPVRFYPHVDGAIPFYPHADGGTR